MLQVVLLLACIYHHRELRRQDDCGDGGGLFCDVFAMIKAMHSRWECFLWHFVLAMIQSYTLSTQMSEEKLFRSYLNLNWVVTPWLNLIEVRCLGVFR